VKELTLEVGAPAPAFGELDAADGTRRSLDSFAGARLVVLIFSSNGCPTVRAFEDRLVGMQAAMGPEVRIVLINANNPWLSPGDSLEEMRDRAASKAYPFPYLKDPDGSVAKAYGAVCTPHVFVLDEERRVAYQGRIADSRDPAKVTEPDLESALADLLAGREVAVPVTQPFGCSIVW
jgi:peroxiredoxin